MNIYLCKINDFEDFEGLSLLTKKRQAKLSCYLRKDDKLRCLCAGLLLRYLLGAKASSVTADAYGKPYLPDESLFFNLSHAGEYAVIAADSADIGVDIEQVKAVPAGIAEKCFTPDELKWLETQNAEKSFYRLWTGKESVIKAVGKGFSLPPKSFTILPPENGLHHVCNAEWYMHWHELDGHILCVSSKTNSKPALCFLRKEALIARNNR